ACPLFLSRHSACSAHCLVGSASRRSNRAGMDAEWDAATDAGGTGNLFLFCQTRLAREPCLYLSAFATRKRLVPLVLRNRPWRAHTSLDLAPPNWKRAVCGGGCFHHHSGPAPRVHELLRVSIFVRRRSLAVLGQPLPDQSGRGYWRQAPSYKSK